MDNKPDWKIIEPNLEKITIGNKDIYLLGTAHISEESAIQAEKIIKQICPTTVAVELCQPRFEALNNPERWKNTDIFKVIREKRAFLLLAQLFLAAFQAKLGKELKIKPGAEMLAAIEAAKEVGAEIILADREIKITLRRAFAKLSWFAIGKLIVSLIFSSFDRKQISREEIERIKSADALDELLREFSKELPELKETLITERDKFISNKIATATSSSIVVIIGAGHIPGVKHYLLEGVTSEEISKLTVLPSRSPTIRIISWLFLAFFLAFFIYGFLTGGGAKVNDLFWSWILISSLSGAIGAAIALAHPLSVLATALSAPLIAPHPMVRVGWITGLVEAYFRRPRVSDLENILEDITTLGGIYRNRLCKILILIAIVNTTVLIGSIYGIKVIAEMTLNYAN
ncbi:MAG TPA: TraB/GumN family protein [Oligoflexia bacterium]|nr:TraB/GumN family protein [Oligoflexia bacterium]HMP26830.1 TraB/GumN family protein [Oligoflexia bacterium]